MIERAGFPAMYLSGAAFSAGALALPDIGLFTLTELVAQTTCLTRAASIPLIVDADTGFGEAVNVERTVTELDGGRGGGHSARGSATAQTLRPPLGQEPGRAGRDGRENSRGGRGPRFGRHCDPCPHRRPRACSGFDAAIERAKRYLGAGADWIFPEALAMRDEFEQFARAIDAPLVANMTEFGKSPNCCR